MLERPDNYIVWDLETTGFNPASDRILEIAALVCIDGKVTMQWSALLNHDIDIPEGAFNVHGISREMCRVEGKEPIQALTTFLKLFDEVKNHVTHNGLRFDIPFLVAEIGRTGIYEGQDLIDFEILMNKYALDTAALYKGNKLSIERQPAEAFHEYGKRVLDVRAPGLKYNVGHCCDEMGIDRSQITQHRAMGDVLLTHAIFQEVSTKQNSVS